MRNSNAQKFTSGIFENISGKNFIPKKPVFRGGILINLFYKSYISISKISTQISQYHARISTQNFWDESARKGIYHSSFFKKFWNILAGKKKFHLFENFFLKFEFFEFLKIIRFWQNFLHNPSPFVQFKEVSKKKFWKVERFWN